MAEGLLSIQKRKTPKESTSKNKRNFRYNPTGKTYQPQKVRRKRVEHGFLNLYLMKLHSFPLPQEACAKTTFNNKALRITHGDKFMKLIPPPPPPPKKKLGLYPSSYIT